MSLKLETPRLFIRSWTDDDLSHYLTLAKDEGYNCFSTPGQFPIEAEEAKKQIKARRQLFEFNGLGKFLVFEKETSELVGTCGLAPYVLEGHEEVELGYRLRLLSWGKGYATESAKKILEDGFKRIHLKRIIAFAVPQNPASLKVIEKLEFKYLKDFVHAQLPHALYELKAQKL